MTTNAQADGEVALAPEVAALMAGLRLEGDALFFDAGAITTATDAVAALPAARREEVGLGLLAAAARLVREVGAAANPAIGVLGALYALLSSPEAAAAAFEQAGAKDAARHIGQASNNRPAPTATPGSANSLLGLRLGKTDGES
jgi:hypothetical protein